MSYRLPKKEKEILLARIEKYIERTESCHNWKGDLGRSGHARIFWNGRKYQCTHIVWLIFKKEPVPEGQVVRHKCDNAACINPEHLELGTQEQNVRDAIERGRFRGTDNLRNSRIAKSGTATLEENPYNF